MATREELNTHSDCGCTPVSAKSQGTNCHTITCASCEQVVAVKRGTSRKICIDFSTCDYCMDGCDDCATFRMAKTPHYHKENLDCIVSEGEIGVDQVGFDKNTGKLFMTFSAFDKRLMNRERYCVKVSAYMPNNDFRNIEFYVVIGSGK